MVWNCKDKSVNRIQFKDDTVLDISVNSDWYISRVELVFSDEMEVTLRKKTVLEEKDTFCGVNMEEAIEIMRKYKAGALCEIPGRYNDESRGD